MNADDLKRWVENRRAAEAREIEEMRNEPLDPATSFRWALDLLAFDEAMNCWPFGRHDPIEESTRGRLVPTVITKTSVSGSMSGIASLRNER